MLKCFGSLSQTVERKRVTGVTAQDRRRGGEEEAAVVQSYVEIVLLSSGNHLPNVPLPTSGAIFQIAILKPVRNVLTLLCTYRRRRRLCLSLRRLVVLHGEQYKT